MEKTQNDLSHIEGPIGSAIDQSQTDVQQLFNQNEIGGISEYNSANVNNLLIPTGQNNNAQNLGEVATFRDENMSLNG